MGRTEAVYKQIGWRLREVREQLGLTQEEVGKRLGISAVGYLHYEAAQRRIPISELERLAVFYGRPIRYFLGENPTPEETAAWQYRSLTDEDRRLVTQMIELLLERRKREAA